jgi:hypothetical protein
MYSCLCIELEVIKTKLPNNLYVRLPVPNFLEILELVSDVDICGWTERRTCFYFTLCFPLTRQVQ